MKYIQNEFYIVTIYPRGVKYDYIEIDWVRKEDLSTLHTRYDDYRQWNELTIESKKNLETAVRNYLIDRLGFKNTMKREFHDLPF